VNLVHPTCSHLLHRLRYSSSHNICHFYLNVRQLSFLKLKFTGKIFKSHRTTLETEMLCRSRLLPVTPGFTQINESVLLSPIYFFQQRLFLVVETGRSAAFISYLLLLGVNGNTHKAKSSLPMPRTVTQCALKGNTTSFKFQGCKMCRSILLGLQC
jgi:hypothetical protein